MRYFLVLFFFLTVKLPVAFCQSNNIYGYITDSISGEAIIGANVVIKQSNAGTSANNAGFYTLPITSTETLELQISAVGYTTLLKVISTGQKNWNFQLSPAAYNLEGVTIVSTSGENTSDHNRLFIQPEKVRELPRLLGEADPLKYIQTLPGIKQGREGSAGLYVRGGTPDQNLIILDGVPNYNVNHLFGYFSVFNLDAIKNIKIYKSGIPARYEGRLSSVLDIAMKEGNLKAAKKIFSLSPIAGSLLLEGPIQKDKSSYMVTIRRTWLDALYRLVTVGDGSDRGFNFYDVNAKYQNKINDQQAIYLSVYSSNDQFSDRYNSIRGEQSKYSFGWSNFTGLLRWNAQLKANAFLNTSVYFSRYNFKQEDENNFNDTKQSRMVNSSIKEWNISSVLDYYPLEQHEIKTGLQASIKTFAPEILQIVNGAEASLKTNDAAKQSVNASYFLEDNIRLSARAQLEVGLRSSWYLQGNNHNVYLQPRAKFNFAVLSDLNLQASYDHIAQHIHLLTNTTLGQPTDLWLPATSKAPTELAHQYNVSLQKSLHEFEFSVSAYYKNIKNVIEYQEGASVIYGIDQGWEDKIAIGKGTSKGVEALIVKKTGKLNGHISYTLSKTDRKFEAINQGRQFPFKYDRRHDGAILVTYNFNKNSKLSALFNYNTGNAITLPVARTVGLLPPNWHYIYDEEVIAKMKNRDLITKRNNVRMPAYHRLDLAYSISKLKKNNRIRTWNFSIYNAYNRLNPYFIYEDAGKLKQYAFFPIIPSVSYSLEI